MLSVPYIRKRLILFCTDRLTWTMPHSRTTWPRSGRCPRQADTPPRAPCWWKNPPASTTWPTEDASSILSSHIWLLRIYLFETCSVKVFLLFCGSLIEKWSYNRIEHPQTGLRCYFYYFIDFNDYCYRGSPLDLLQGDPAVVSFTQASPTTRPFY